MSLESHEFRRALGMFATGVTIVTTRSAEGKPIGLTANSFTSVSLDPPLVLFCVGRRSYSSAHFERSTHFAVNVLSEDQHGLSARFARSSDDKWNDVAFGLCGVGCPAFADALAVFECETYRIHDGGDHVIVIGKVLSCTSRLRGGAPLLFFRGDYGRVACDDVSAAKRTYSA
jgi:flavin reductase (DIM6/NTAB) family NADH-FMN oxidoreductase RutF